MDTFLRQRCAFRRASLVLPLAALLVGVTGCRNSEPSFDVILSGGSVLDGSGSDAFTADVGIRDGVGCDASVAKAIRIGEENGNASVMSLDLYDTDNTRYLAQQDWMTTCADGNVVGGA